MKNRLMYSFMLIPLLTGCDLLKDATEITISTELNADIPVVVSTSMAKSAVEANAVTAIAFSKSQDLTLASNADLEPYLSKIEEINLNSLLITVNGLGEGQTVNTFSLDVTGVGNIFMQTNITMTNNTFTPEISAGILDQVATKLFNDKQITLTVSGTASGPMTFTAFLSFDSEVIAQVL